MDQLNQHINSPNHKILYYDLMSKIIVKLGINIFNRNYKSSLKLIDLHRSLLMIISGPPEKDLPFGEVKFLTSKLCTYYVKSSSSLFLCSIFSILSFFWSGHRGSKAYSLWGGVIPSLSIGYDYL